MMGDLVRLVRLVRTFLQDQKTPEICGFSLGIEGKPTEFFSLRSMVLDPTDKGEGGACARQWSPILLPLPLQ